MGYSPWGRDESDSTEQLHFPFSLSCIGEGNGNPLQCSGLENPSNGGTWWAAVYGVAQSQTQLKRLGGSSSSSSMDILAVLLLIIQEHGIPFHFFESFSIRNIFLLFNVFWVMMYYNCILDFNGIRFKNSSI